MSVAFSGLKNPGRLYERWVIIALAALLFTSCSSSDKAPSSASSEKPPSRSFLSIVSDTFTGSFKGAFQAVQTPLEDINLKRGDIPDQLKPLIDNPYSVPTPLDCSSVYGEISGLDLLLGPEVINGTAGHDSLVNAWNTAHNISWQDKDKYVNQGSKFLQEKAADEVKNHVSIIPYRSWLRWISGADSHARKVREAYVAGKMHRAFLRGIAVNLHCTEKDLKKPAPQFEVKQEVTDVELASLHEEKEK